MSEFILPILHAIIFFTSLFSVLYSFGIVWRVEKKLDISYKFFLLAIFAFAASEALIVFEARGKVWLAVAQLALRTIFAIFFLAGTLEMRSLLRKLDGEKMNKK